MIRGNAAQAITELAPTFLEDVLIKLAKSRYAYGAIIALRKANTQATRAALAETATSGDDHSVRIWAIQSLGRSNDTSYLPSLFKLMESEDKEIQYVAAAAAGNVGGSAAVNRLLSLVSNPDAKTRSAGANGLGQTRAREAVPILIELLLDSDLEVRQNAVAGLLLLTHYVAFEGNEWADISTAESAAAVHQRWVNWWSSHRTSCEMHGMADCASPKPL
jgi:HEAT repeat protein